MKLSLMLNVYNEADVLPFIEPVLKHVDQAVITEGGPIGLSSDNTGEIIRNYQKTYGHIHFFQGEFVREDEHGFGGWAEAESKNRMLEVVDGDYLMLSHADIIYDEIDMIRLREAIERFPKKAIYYAPMLEWIYDMEHIRLYYAFDIENLLYRPLVGDVPALSMRLKPYYVNHPTIAIQLQPWTPDEALFMPHMRRFHLGFARPYPRQIEKRLNILCQRDWGELGETIIAQGFEACLQAAIDQVEAFASDFSVRDYSGEYPEILGGKRFSVNDGREEFYDNIDTYKTRFYRYYEQIEKRMGT
jgi:hypothetical protein